MKRFKPCKPSWMPIVRPLVQLLDPAAGAVSVQIELQVQSLYCICAVHWYSTGATLVQIQLQEQYMFLYCICKCAVLVQYVS